MTHTVLKPLLRYFFLQTALDAFTDKLWWNLVARPKNGQGLFPRTETGLLEYVRRGQLERDWGLTYSTGTFKECIRIYGFEYTCHLLEKAIERETR